MGGPKSRSTSARQFDAVVASALSDPDEFRTSATAYRRSGHRIEVVAVAMAEAWSRLGSWAALWTGRPAARGQKAAGPGEPTCRGPAGPGGTKAAGLLGAALKKLPAMCGGDWCRRQHVSRGSFGSDLAKPTRL
ncbi:zeta toxin family protein [Streptomyces bikiniensis]|uniref:zeta toxin family protein n=1 Tax=Streptomyces bikiniensis TaxID=1896 RepID=UPI00131A4AD2|nr:zeta toxin family protein [Streptomyces bikiniensis]